MEKTISISDINKYFKENVSYKNWRFEFERLYEDRQDYELCTLRIKFEAPCNDTGKTITLEGDCKVWLNRGLKSVIEQVWRKIKGIEIHEAAEQFYVHEMRPYDEHIKLRGGQEKIFSEIVKKGVL